MVPVIPSTKSVLSLADYLVNLRAQGGMLKPTRRLLALLPTMVRHTTAHRVQLRTIAQIAAAQHPPLLVLPPIPVRTAIENNDLSTPELTNLRRSSLPMPKSPLPPPNLAQQLLERAGTMTDDRMAGILEDSLDPIPSGYLVPIERITPWEGQPRKRFDDKKIDELAASMAAVGLLQPLLVRRDPQTPGHFIVLAGHRRLLAARRVYGSEDPDVRERVERLACIVREAADDQAFADALVENLVRDDLTRSEVMDAVVQLQQGYGWSVREIAKRTGRNASDISILVRIARHPEASQLVAEERITTTAIGHLLRLPKAAQDDGLALVRAGRIRTVEDALTFAARAKAPPSPAVNDEVAPREESIEPTEKAKDAARVISHTPADAEEPDEYILAPTVADLVAVDDTDIVHVKAHTRVKVGAARQNASEDPLAAALRRIVAIVQDHALTLALGPAPALPDAAWQAVWRMQDEAVERLAALTRTVD